MSVSQHKDGRWICRHPKGKDPERPEATARYFPRGTEGKEAARAFNAALGLSKQKPPNLIAFYEIANAYISARKPHIAKSTLNTTCGKLENTIIPLIGHTMVHEITPNFLDKYVVLRAETVKMTTIHRELSDIRAIIRWAFARNIIPKNPIDNYQMPKRDDARISPPTKREVDALITCAVPHMKRAMLVSYYTGLRPGREELLSLTWDAVDFYAQTITVTSALKGGLPVRLVPLHSTILQHLEQWYSEDIKHEYRYIINYHGQKIASLKTAWKNTKKRAKITRRLRMYDLRHAFVTTLLEKGADLKSVSEIVGHTSTDMTMRVYHHVNIALKKKTIDLLE